MQHPLIPQNCSFLVTPMLISRSLGTCGLWKLPHTTSSNLLALQLELPPHQKHSLITSMPQINATSAGCVSLSIAAVIIDLFASHGIERSTNPQSWLETNYLSIISNVAREHSLFDLTNSEFYRVYTYADPEIALDHWLYAFNSVYDKHAPFRTHKVRHI